MRKIRMFIETTCSQYIPLHQIARISRGSKDKLYARTLTTVNGTTYQVIDYSVEDFKLRASAFAATPGYYLVCIPADHYLVSEPDFAFERIPITAWSVNEWGFLSPLTVESPLGTGQRWAIQCPDGSVIEPDEPHWDSLDHCQRDCREEAAKSRTKEPASS
jgi:hypothetical protein